MERMLTENESNILHIIQDIYGNQYTEEKIFFSESEACILIQGKSGESVMFANISNLAAWRSDGSITSDQELREKWLTT